MELQPTSTIQRASGDRERQDIAALYQIASAESRSSHPFSIDVERLLDAGTVVVMQGYCVAKGKATGKSVRAAVSHVFEIADGNVRFDQYVASATINPILGT